MSSHIKTWHKQICYNVNLITDIQSNYPSLFSEDSSLGSYTLQNTQSYASTRQNKFLFFSKTFKGRAAAPPQGVIIVFNGAVTLPFVTVRIIKATQRRCVRLGCRESASNRVYAGTVPPQRHTSKTPPEGHRHEQSILTMLQHVSFFHFFKFPKQPLVLNTGAMNLSRMLFIIQKVLIAWNKLFSQL